ncbi:dihydrofolate reductase family protein [Owenweeksia hongkongensis]|uniref:dihydrofolate reductase family protein n=1 Tax=Owenweeksia hongkongensis TaxID=253245 RepID=UPI003A918C7F
MRKISLYIAASLDGYIAKPDGDIKWLVDFPNPEKDDFGYNHFIKEVETTLMGGATFRQIADFEEWPYPDKENFVLTRQKGEESSLVTFVTSDVVDFVKELRKKKGGLIWLIGGGSINTIFMQNDLVDEIILTVVPIVLGDGIPLFAKGDLNKTLKLQKTEAFSNGMVQLTYSKQ